MLEKLPPPASFERYKCGVVFCENQINYVVVCIYCDALVRIAEFSNHFGKEHYTQLKQPEPLQDIPKIEEVSEDENTDDPLESEAVDENSDEEIDTKFTQNEIFIDDVQHIVEKGYESDEVDAACDDEATASTDINSGPQNTANQQSTQVAANSQNFTDNAEWQDIFAKKSSTHFSCNFCGLQMKTKVGLLLHMRKVHQYSKKPANFEAPIMEVKAQQPSTKVENNMRHDETKNVIKLPQEKLKVTSFSCNLCGLMLKTQLELSLHKKILHEGAKIKLIKPAAIVPKTSTMVVKQLPIVAEAKIDKCTTNVEVIDVDDKKEEKINSFIFSCDTCGMQLATEAALSLHMKKFHPAAKESVTKPETLEVSTSSKSKSPSPEFFMEEFISGDESCDVRETYEEHDKQSPSSPIQATETNDITENDTKMTYDDPNGDFDSYSDGISESNDSSNKFYRSKEMLFACKMCTCKFETKVGLVVHMKRQHKDELPPRIPSLPKKKQDPPRLAPKQPIRQDPEPTHSNKFDCPHCDKDFPTRSDVFMHIAIAHNPATLNDGAVRVISNVVLQPNPNQQEKPEGASSSSIKSKRPRSQFACELCNDSFSQEHLLICHIVRAHNHNSCDFCGKTYKSSTAVMDHRLTHTGERCFQCPDCDKKFSSRGKLHSHSQNHRPIKESICHICGRNCRGQSNYLRHMRRHTGERPFKCRICDKRFFEGFDRNIHESGHFDEKPFPCNICGRYFRYPKAVRVHKKTHIKERNAACTLCKKRFINEKGLKEHMRVHEKVTSLIEREETMEMEKNMEKEENVEIEENMEIDEYEEEVSADLNYDYVIIET